MTGRYDHAEEGIYLQSGWTYKDTFVLYDRETETLWYPYEKGLMGIQGKYYKRWLPKTGSTDTLWHEWKKRYPDTLLLK